MMAVGEYWSIGEVLSLLQDEFPEITISKIRFLESQGLIQPERTPSGYRRFYQNDFDLLQWILVQQRDHYLPLKVIRDRIESGDTEQGLLDFSAGTGEQPSAASTSRGSPARATGKERPDEHEADRPEVDDDAEASSAIVAATLAGDQSRVGSPLTGEPSPVTERGIDEQPGEQPTLASTRIVASTGPKGSAVAPIVEPVTPLALTRDELAESSGCSVKMIGDLERYGLVKGRKAGPTVLYDNTALLISRIAGQFATFGLEPRHLRTFLIGAEREIGLVHQVVEPMLHRRDEETRRKAHETLEDLTDLAGSLRSILMRQATEELLPKH